MVGKHHFHLWETIVGIGLPGSSLWSRSCHCWNTSKQSFASCSMHWLDCGRSFAAIRWRFFSSMMWFPPKFEAWSQIKQQLSSTFSWFIWFFSMFWICFNNEIWFAMIEYGKCNSNHDCRDYIDKKSRIIQPQTIYNLWLVNLPPP